MTVVTQTDYPKSIREEIQRVKAEKPLPYREARRLVEASSPSSASSSSSPAGPSYASALRSAPRKVTISFDCQTPAFWVGQQPTLLEASKLSSVQTSCRGRLGTLKTSRVGAWTGTLKNPMKCLWRLEPDRRSNFFSPSAHLCAVTYMTEISLIVTLNNLFNSVQRLPKKLNNQLTTQTAPKT